MDFPARIAHLPEMLDHVKTAALQAGLNKDRIYKLELTTEEAIVNIISYAYPDDDTGTIGIFCENSGQGIFHVTFRDRGVPFNPLKQKPDIDVTLPLEERKVGGLGIFLIQQFVDDLSYERDGKENIFKIAISLA